MAPSGGLLAYHLAHGMTAAADSWASVPYSEAVPAPRPTAARALRQRDRGRCRRPGARQGGRARPSLAPPSTSSTALRRSGTRPSRAPIARGSPATSHYQRNRVAVAVPRAGVGRQRRRRSYSAHVDRSRPALRRADPARARRHGHLRRGAHAVWNWMMAYPMQNEVWCQVLRGHVGRRYVQREPVSARQHGPVPARASGARPELGDARPEPDHLDRGELRQAARVRRTVRSESRPRTTRHGQSHVAVRGGERAPLRANRRRGREGEGLSGPELGVLPESFRWPHRRQLPQTRTRSGSRMASGTMPATS